MAFIFAGYRVVFLPLRGLSQQLTALYRQLPLGSGTPPALMGIGVLAREFGRLALWAQDYYQKHQEVSAALAESRNVLARLNREYAVALRSSSLQSMQQHQVVLAYANYLDERIQQHRLDPGMRYDFDDVCESSFNLKLIGAALTQLRPEHPPALEPFKLASLMQQTMLALAASLDRRSMQLSTAEVDEAVQAYTEPQLAAQVLWMVLLGIIRYAEAESTLRLRCLNTQDGRHAMISIAVSELAPGSLTAVEREAHLVRQLQHLTPHMFAETIRIHANMQLAELLLEQLNARVEILPLTSYSCEICIFLPAA